MDQIWDRKSFEVGGRVKKPNDRAEPI